jgi:cobyrinic acid a,c-diamide synthase
MIPSLVVAGTHSGAGKTTVMLGILAALSRRGLAVQGFKVGPDFIDPSFYQALTGREGENLDSWMTGSGGVRRIYQTATGGADLAVIEGVMGLFDGASPVTDESSTAEIAKLLNLPVVLVIDARSMARSVAALVKGFTEFDPRLRFAGIILNRVGSAKHFELLTQALAATTAIPVLGYLPKEREFSLAERHLGLVPYYEDSQLAERLAGLAEWFEKTVAVDRLIAAFAHPSLDSPPALPPVAPLDRRVRIGVARDRAFGFYYQENWRLLRRAGAELVPFSPLSDATLPAGLDGLYLGGGYPELFAAELAANQALLEQIKELIARGKPVYAECGGLIYLARSLRVGERSFPMLGVLDLEVELGARLAALGYIEVSAAADNILLAQGETARGHEFHYTRICGGAEQADAYRSARGERLGFRRGNLLASYVHLHFGSNPGMAERWVRIAAECQS